MNSYKSKELNIFSSDENYKLRIAEEKVPVLGSNVAKIAYGMPDGKSGSGTVSGYQAVYIPLIATDINDMPQYIGGAILNLRNSVMAEASTARAAESKIASDAKSASDANASAIAAEASRATSADSKHSTDIADEKLARQQDVFNLSNDILNETKGRASADGALGNAIFSNKALFDSYVTSNDSAVEAVHIRISEYHVNYNQRFANSDSTIRNNKIELEERLDTAESNITSTQASVMDESGRAQIAEAGLQTQISNLLANTDSVALNSLAELCADYRVNSSGISANVSALEARVVFLEGVISQLVAKVL